MSRRKGQTKRDSGAGAAFAKRFSEARKRLKLTLSKVATDLSEPGQPTLKASLIESWELGRMPQSPNLILTFCKKYSTAEDPISFTFLMTGEMEPQHTERKVDLSEFFDRQEVVSEALCEITIKRLIPKPPKKPDDGGKS